MSLWQAERVLFSFAPSNEDALDPETTLESLEEFTDFIKTNFKAELISDPNNYIYRSGYFYDSNFHMNDAGMVVHTANLANDIAKALGKELLKEIEIPDVPEKPDIPDVYDYDENEKYFVFDEIYSGGNVAGYAVKGLSELGKTQSTLTTPKAYNGKLVASIRENAFNGAENLSELFVTENINQINDGAFKNTPKLKTIHILAKDPNMTTVNNLSGGLTEGMADDAYFYVASSSYSEFSANYFWGVYSARIRPE